MNAVFPAVIMDQLERRKALVSWERCRIWVSLYPGSHSSVCFLPVLVLQATNAGVRRPGYEARIWAHRYRQLVANLLTACILAEGSTPDHPGGH